MLRLSLKPFVFGLLRGVPMPLIAICLGLAVGLAVWAVLDRIQTRQVDKIFSQELQIQLEQRARESLVRFDRYLANYGAMTRLLANHRRLAEYLEPLFWSQDAVREPVRYDAFRPPWLPDYYERDALGQPSLFLLTDSAGGVREIYEAAGEPVPEVLLTQVPKQFLSAREVRSVIERFDERLYLLTSDAVEDTGGYAMGYLVILMPVDDAFLAASQRGLPAGRAAVALVDDDDQRLLASIDSAALPPGSGLDEWRETYAVTSQSLSQYEGSDSNLLFAVLVPHATVEKMSRHVSIFERRQRAIGAVVFILAFSAVIYLVSVRLNKVLTRMTRFSQRALGIADPGFRHAGNQLLLLEEWIAHFTQLVLTAREEMNRRHQAEMRESEALKAAMMEASLDAVVTLDDRGHVIEFNPAAERLFGIDRAATLGGRFSERFLPDVARPLFQRVLDHSRHRHREPRARDELLVLRGDGTEIPVELSIALIELEARRFHTLFIHDIRNRKLAEREIKSLARFASESPNPILRVAEEGRVVYANQASGPLLGALDSAFGQPLPAELAREVALALGDGAARERELDLGGAIYALLLAPVPDQDYVNIYGRDITAVRRAEQEARQHQAELVHVCRLSTMGEMATGMAHELNQPLSAIVNYANGCSRRLQSGNARDEDLLGAMAQIAAQAQRASAIIRRLRALVGKQPPSQIDADLNQLIREVCSFIELDTARQGVEVRLELDAQPLMVRVDLVQIEQVLLNLMRNALDAMDRIPPDRRVLRIVSGIREGMAQVRLTDTGCGIPPERLPLLFDPFYTTKEAGMGMGLAISQTIVDNHNGRIWATSAPDQGATFHLLLPLAAPPSTGNPAP